MDLLKAFDIINLIAKRDTYGFDTESLKLIKSYLTNRLQRTKVNTCFSTGLDKLRARNVHAKRLSRERNYVHVNQSKHL